MTLQHADGSTPAWHSQVLTICSDIFLPLLPRNGFKRPFTQFCGLFPSVLGRELKDFSVQMN